MKRMEWGTLGRRGMGRTRKGGRGGETGEFKLKKGEEAGKEREGSTKPWGNWWGGQEREQACKNKSVSDFSSINILCCHFGAEVC